MSTVGTPGPSAPTGPVPSYSWPDGDDFTVTQYGSGGPGIAIGLLPHANEPLGSAVLPVAKKLAARFGRLWLLGPIEPPEPDARFPLPCELTEFLALGRLPALRDQVEFAHGAVVPHTSAQRRADTLRRAVRAAEPSALVLLHNDPFARFPYLYADRPRPFAERRLLETDGFPSGTLERPGWTRRIGARTYAWFPAARLGVHGQEAAGVFLPRVLGIPVFTLELPMFRWDGVEQARRSIREAMGAWIADGAGDPSGMLTTAHELLGGRRVEMVDAATTAEVIAAFLAGVVEEVHRAQQLGVPAATGARGPRRPG
ncbi:hypothetical protein OG899_26425 [Streptomyces thermoviolaceus]|uniref:Uncharacterized protein n=1 Tax=Streptomyces thermoviolaceus subsp. thermoviolaceus TaxID=66860 RepID=A0ABX0YRP8_STRTL|nr:hypothetical protein [Streptomyces thermoviolaceus]NJP15257.1 hypothetical protein [Streptomyces thermoviolaceus subsp. thermoviolaceus]WTD50744.1 hypothetical protein OG899_26425 [Streptomyces thermoviolaceus]